MASENVFFEEWQRCLREHYLHVVRTDDHVTEPTLREVLLQTGFTLAEIEEFYYIGQWQRDHDTHDEPNDSEWAASVVDVDRETSALEPAPIAAEFMEADDADDMEEAEVIEPHAEPERPIPLMEVDSIEVEEEAEAPPPPEPPPTKQMSLF